MTWRWGFAGLRIEIRLQEGSDVGRSVVVEGKEPARVEAAGGRTRGKGDRRRGARPGCEGRRREDMRR